MQAADWIVDYLIRQGVTDSFGIPGAVILDLLYAMEKRKPEITPHLVYHEQGGAFSACGYSQASGNLCVAYGTRGPGFTNMMTGIAEAYYDSLPVVFLTAHSAADLNPRMRILNNQEMDTVSIVSKITKYAARINTLDQLGICLKEACMAAVTGRKGPVFLDILSSLFGQDCLDENKKEVTAESFKPQYDDLAAVTDRIIKQTSVSQRPVFLIGNGMRDRGLIEKLEIIVERSHIPVLSSRTSQDIFSFSDMYYGHIGSHATRYSNFILSKADLIISLGNRMAVSVDSKSFKPIFDHAHTIRIDIDNNEFQREIPNSESYTLDLHDLMPDLVGRAMEYPDKDAWIGICDRLREGLGSFDTNDVVDNIMSIMGQTDSCDVYVCDVGNHGFWVTNAFSYSKRTNKILYSGSFGTLGNALPKAIGAYYAAKAPVICFVGDQGLQMNSQELEVISRDKLPIAIVVLNNKSSGMIKEREDKRFDSIYVHTTVESGYSLPDLGKLAIAYGLDYVRYDKKFAGNLLKDKPCIIELEFSDELELYPYLPVGAECQNLYPKIDGKLYNELNSL